jgi:DNA polymerase (family 10)
MLTGGLVKVGRIRIFKKGKYHVTLETKEIIQLAYIIRALIKPFTRRFEFAGSIRRKAWLRNKPVVDIDIVLIPKSVTAADLIVAKLREQGEILSAGDKRIEARIKGVKVDVYFAHSDYWGAMMLFATGSGGHNIGLRRIAMKKGLLLNQYGLWRGDERIASTETGIYKALGRPRYKRPEERF